MERKAVKQHKPGQPAVVTPPVLGVGFVKSLATLSAYGVMFPQK
jgi:hypothetical protein